MSVVPKVLGLSASGRAMIRGGELAALVAGADLGCGGRAIEVLEGEPERDLELKWDDVESAMITFWIGWNY